MDNLHLIGASLYVPGIHPDLASVMAGRHPENPRSVIICTEDSIDESDVETALRGIHAGLTLLPTNASRPLCFIRPRSPGVLGKLLSLPAIDRADGFVIPKADVDTLPNYLRLLGGRPAMLMPILETVAVFDPARLAALRDLLLERTVRPRILGLRVGGNDLLRLLGMKRLAGASIYETPLGVLIPQLVMMFQPFGLRLTGVAVDFFEDDDLLRREAMQDRLMGLVGKTAIHPRQIRIIEEAFNVTQADVETATAVVQRPSARAFGLHGAMLEPAVHAAWARDVLARHMVQAPPVRS